MKTVGAFIGENHCFKFYKFKRTLEVALKGIKKNAAKIALILKNV